MTIRSQQEKESTVQGTNRVGLVNMFTHPIFEPPGDLTSREQAALTYRRMAHVQDRLPATEPLLHRPELLRDLIELSAMVDPTLFHVLHLHHCMATGSILDQAAVTDELPGRGPGFSVGTILAVELGLGNTSNVGNARTEVVYDPENDDFVLNTPDAGATKFSANVGLDGVAKWAVLPAQLVVAGSNCGAFGFVVPLRDENGPLPGVHVKPLPPTALLPMDYAAVRFDNVRLTRAQWLSDTATVTTDGIFHDPLDRTARTLRSLGAVRFAWGAHCLGLAAAARAAVAITVPYTARRLSISRSGAVVPVITFRNQQRLLLTALAAALAATALGRPAAMNCWRLATGDDAPPTLTPSFMRTASVTKVAVVQLAERAASRARACCGALGFFSANRIIDFEGLALAFQSAGGDNQMTLLNAAWIMANSIDYEPPVAKKAFHGGRLDLDTLVDLLGSRESLLQERLRERLATAADGGTDPAVAWDQQITHAQELAEAHLARLTAEAFAAWAERENDELLRPPLRKLCELLIFEEISDHAGWYLAEGLIRTEDVTTLPDQLDSCCDQLFPDLQRIADLLEVPTELLHAPIATDDYMAAFLPAPSSSPALP
jgi:acyl-CoA oxidase